MEGDDENAVSDLDELERLEEEFASKEEQEMLLCNTDSDEEEDQEHQYRDEGQGESKEEHVVEAEEEGQPATSPGSPVSSVEMNDFLHHLNELQRYYKVRTTCRGSSAFSTHSLPFQIETQKLNEERAQHEADLVLLEKGTRTPCTATHSC